ncbi:uncharacterized protein PG998_010966 [Apiospora kogelbergensis]|uniref:Uncharacterized protein n=1 Tax=Apiospora kogelbergensis TaxID=1337665 RepID=A0AAW0RDF0_9PEZI
MGNDAVNLELYQQEWRKGVNEGSFKGKQAEIEKQFLEFWEDASAKEDVNAYLGNDLEHAYSTRDKGVKPKTPFTNFNKNNPEKILAAGRDVIIVGNHASFDIAQYPEHGASAGMSMIHLLGLTTESVYNGVSLTDSNVGVIDKIIRLFGSNWPKADFKEKVLQHQLDAINRVWGKALEDAKEASTEAAREEAKAVAHRGHELALEHYKELEWKINDLEVADFEFGLHLYPDHSIPHFHMHIIAMRKGMRNWSTSQHDEKTKDAGEVRDFIRNHYSSEEARKTQSSYRH